MTKQNIGLRTSFAVLLASTLVVAVQWDAPVAVKAPLALLVALVLPGWLGFQAVRGRPPRTLVEAAVSLAGSVGLLIALGIFLDILDSGLTPESWSLSLLAILVMLALVVVFRHANSQDAPEAQKNVSLITSRSSARRNIGTAVQITVSAVLLSLATITTLTSQRAELADQHLTELWLTGDAETQLVQVLNREGTPMDYRVTVTVQGKRPKTTAFRLADGEEWTTAVEVPQRPRKGDEAPLVAVSLYRGDEIAVYREVHLNRASP